MEGERGVREEWRWLRCRESVEMMMNGVAGGKKGK